MRTTLGLIASLALAATAAAAQPTQDVGGRPATSLDVLTHQTGTEPANADLRTEFTVKFVRQDTVYLDGGYTAGLAEGMTLNVKGSEAEGVVAELMIVGVAQTSAVAEIREGKRAIAAGDKAYLSAEGVQALVDTHALGNVRKFPAVISFTEGGEVLDEEAHADVPRPPMPSTNQARGRIGFDYLGATSLDAGSFRARDVGMMFQGNFTRIGGSDWTLNGYWRGRLNVTRSDFQPTLQDLINRTYHLSLTHDGPTTGWVAGVGRLYLPWATSLETLDGGYVGAHVTRTVTAGVFGGSSPDPTSYNYNPDLERGGAFVNVQVGSFDSVRYSGTGGAGADYVKWQLDRPFLFFENSFSVGRTLSIYHAMQADKPSGNPVVAAPGAGIGRSLLTVHWTPVARIQLDANDTYFRDIPTFAPELIGTGLLDKYLFQGYSGGARVELFKGLSVYTELGRSSRTGDAADALNEMYGVTLNRTPLNARIDAHYSKFSSAFGKGEYQALSVTRSIGRAYRADVLAGSQTFTSAPAGNQSARFLTATLDASLGAMLFVDGSVTVYRGALQNYDQWLLTIGYRFDTKRSRP